ncbi:pentapeptide repeat-containing protein [Sphingomonas sp.]|uniref:pentapeptide repeat-containing protein n=1 Tax=Sphingomonas sp. TaxID=28214 RepID=UPI002E2F4152|nr:pentapeptide repeat-containing protein [Sphingomonas sp.]HEX4693569.1 pentapeptide repeat-containing protein [Sphingomonas sp.]
MQLPVARLTGLPSEGTLRGDFTYKLIQDADIANVALEHSLWTGAVLRNCKFTNVSFARSDFAGTRFVDCKFIRCNFEPDEFRSCFMTRVCFEGCALSGINCVGTEFDTCTFEGCDMRRTAVRECQFRKCQFDDISFAGSSTTLNRYDQSQFNRVTFGDATILFLIFRECRFQNCAINAETLGYTFGLTLADLGDFDLIYLGEEQERPEDVDLLSVLVDTYRARRWALGVCLLELNFHLAAPYLALRTFAHHLARDVAAEPRLEWDELLFVCFVLEDLAARDELPFLAAWEINAAVAAAMQAVEQSRHGFGGLVPSAGNIAWRLGRLSQNRLADVLADISYSPDETATLTLTMTERPTIGLPEAIPAELFSNAGGARSEMRLVRASEGSWVEVWQISAGALVSLKLGLALVDSTWEQATKLWTRTKSAGTTIKGWVKKDAVVAAASAALPAPGVLALPSAPDLPASPALDLTSVAAAVERATADLRVITDMDREAMLRLDIAVKRLSLLGDQNVRRLLEYGAPNLMSIAISPAQG